MTFRLQIIGGGNMGEALARGLLTKEWASEDEMHLVEPVVERRKYLAETLPCILNSEAPLSNLYSLIAVKPDKVKEFLEVLADLRPPRVLSLSLIHI